MATFAGHDHDNDYIGMLYNVGLAFGRVSGWDAYGDFERGGRIIELREGKFEFDSWIRTSSGMPSIKDGWIILKRSSNRIINKSERNFDEKYLHSGGSGQGSFRL